MREQNYLTQEQHTEATSQATQDTSKLLSNVTMHVLAGMPEEPIFTAAYNEVIAEGQGSMWNAAQMYEIGRIAGIKAERERRNAQKKKREYIDLKRKELIEKYPEMKDSTEKASDKAIEMVGILQTLTDQERNLFITYFERKE